MQGRGQHQRVSLRAERCIRIIAGIAVHRIGQRLKQSQQAIALLVFRRGQVHQRIGQAQAVQLTAEDLQVFAVGAVDLAHRYDLDLIPGVGGIGQDRGNGVVGRFRQGLRVVYRLCRIGVNGEVAVQRDRRYIDTFHGKYIPFLPQWAASFL